MEDRATYRLQDIKQSIVHIRTLLRHKTFASMYEDAATRAAFERFLEILSEASRHVPDDLKASHGPDIPWRQIADLGNVLRHAYHRTDAQALWSVYEDDLTPLEESIDAMLLAVAKPPEG
ncbi:HepT-like ribonuclease domain-containing protein [Devosia sp.]|uniref:HepT-like ribonuclease domain-containing protein n=1 Tax=Devosia sp. TaxID=1871048 RepID=UPI0032651FBF